MKRYEDVTDFVDEQIGKLSLTEQVTFLQNLIYQFANNLPNDWLDDELEREKPHYQAIFAQIIQQPTRQTWQADVIVQHLSDLDDIMWQMGETYPHSTSDAILLIMELLDYWLVLIEVKQKSDASDDIITSATMGYLSYFDALVEEQTGELADNATWLDYPQTAQGFEMLKIALAKPI